MRKSVSSKSNTIVCGLATMAIAAGLAACGGGATSQTNPAPDASKTAAADTARAAELEARAQDLARREAEIAAKEQAEAARQQEALQAAQREQAAAKNAAAKKVAMAKPAASKATTPVSTHASLPPPRPAAAPPLEVPAGTQLTLALSSDLSTKTARPGDAFEATLASDLMAADRRVAPAGARITGTVTEVVSGSHAIGAVPMLSLRFEQLQLPDGRQVPISAELVQQGQSEKGRDAAKILGGAAAGAIVGHQVKSNRTGSIVGGLLGGAAGAVVAKNTGTEVELAAGSTLAITLGEGFKVASN